MQRERETRSRLGKWGKKLSHWLPVLLWMALVFYLSAQPDRPHHPEDTIGLIIRKVGHMAEYAVLAGLVWWAWFRNSEGGTQRILLHAFALSGLYAICDEVHRFFVPGRNGRFLHAGFDSLGAILGLLVISSLGRTALLALTKVCLSPIIQA